MSAPQRIPYAPTPSSPAGELPRNAPFAGQDVTTATSAIGVEYTPSPTYQLAVTALYADPNTLAVHAAYTALGHRRGGTRVTDAQLGELFSVAPKTIQRARRVLYDCDLYTEHRVGREMVRRTKRPSEFIHLPGIVVRALMSGEIGPAEFRLYCHVLHRRAERGAQAGCGLTRDELAAELGVRPDTITDLVASLCAKGFLHRQGRTGVGWVLIPKYADPVRRRISATARFELAARRRRWGIPRPGRSTPPPARPVVTPLPGVHPPRSLVSTHPDAEGVCSPRSEHVDPDRPLERQGLNEPVPVPGGVDGDPAAPWDRDPRSRWTPPPGPDWRTPRTGVPRPPDLDWHRFRRSVV